ncbi:hypothetical protein ZX61_02490 [Vibrio sp. VPAP30]|nr:hypothetical protein ZX61_02490 [Vibrio sp. VPAP30]
MTTAPQVMVVLTMAVTIGVPIMTAGGMMMITDRVMAEMMIKTGHMMTMIIRVTFEAVEPLITS